jgi:hypothetical protein
MNPFTTADADDRLGIYLNDHRAVIVGELALADRCRNTHIGTDLAHQLTIHIGAVSDDRDLIDDFLDQLDHGIDHVKGFAATLGERIGRFKLNGQLVGRSPLSPVVELEGLIAATHARQVMWNALAERKVLDVLNLERVATERGAAAAEQLDVLRPYLYRAIGDALTKLQGPVR